MNEPPASTKQRILEAAERLFAERGVAGASLRAVIAEAGVNLAAVHYHFGSKEALLKAVVGRLVDPLNEQRLKMLERCETAAGKRRPSLERVVEAFVAPTLRLSQDPERGETFMKLMGRLLAEPDYFFGTVVPAKFADVRNRFAAAIEKALPGLPREEVLWRLLFGIGAMAHTMRFASEFGAVAGGWSEERDIEKTIRRLVGFIVAGLKAPPVGARKR